MGTRQRNQSSKSSEFQLIWLKCKYIIAGGVALYYWYFNSIPVTKPDAVLVFCIGNLREQLQWQLSVKGLCLIRLCINFIIDAYQAEFRAIRLWYWFWHITVYWRSEKGAISEVPSRFHYHNSQHIKRGMKFP